MTLQEYLENICIDIDEDIEDEELTTKLIKYINRGYKELIKKEDLKKKISIVVTDDIYTLPSNCKDVITIDEAIPYNVVGSKLYIASGEYELTYTYIAEPLESLDDETITSPLNDEFIINFAKYLYYMSEEELEMANFFKNECNNMVIKQKVSFEKIIDVYGGDFIV